MFHCTMRQSRSIRLARDSDPENSWAADERTYVCARTHSSISYPCRIWTCRSKPSSWNCITEWTAWWRGQRWAWTVWSAVLSCPVRVQSERCRLLDSEGTSSPVCIGLVSLDRCLLPLRIFCHCLTKCTLSTINTFWSLRIILSWCHDI